VFDGVAVKLMLHCNMMIYHSFLTTLIHYCTFKLANSRHIRIDFCALGLSDYRSWNNMLIILQLYLLGV